MNRRIAIQNLALILGGAIVFPSCNQDDPRSIKLKNFDLSDNQIKLVESITDTIIPKTATLGAKDLNLKDFVFKMLDDCTSKNDQQKFFSGASQFEERCNNLHKKPFFDCNILQREAILNSIEQQQNNSSEDLYYFYKYVKTQTVFGFKQSKYFLTSIKKYEMIPGHYESHYPVSKLKKTQLT